MIQLAAWCLAFWAAVLRYGGHPRPYRFTGGLVLGAFFAHVGWILLHWHIATRNSVGILDLATDFTSGFTVLFFPLGMVLLLPTAAAIRPLPVALAVARLGCLAGGCCGGTVAPWGGTHPAPLYEIAGLVALHCLVRRLGDRWVLPAFLVVFGSVRLAVQPWRAMSPLVTPAIDPEWIAACWVVIGAAWAIQVVLKGDGYLAYGTQAT